MRSQILGWLGDSFWQLLWWWCECCYRGPTHKSQIWGWLSVAFWRWIPFSMKLNDEPWWKFSYQSSWDVWLVSLIPCFGGLCEERLPCFVGLVAFWMMPFWMILSENYATLAMKESYVCRSEVLEVVVREKKRKLLTGKQMRKVPEASHSFPGKISSDQESLRNKNSFPN